MNKQLANPKLRPNADRGDLIAWDEFLECVEDGMFIDYDGMGSWATETHHLDGADNWVRPSQVKSGKAVKPDWASHVLWYNR